MPPLRASRTEREMAKAEQQLGATHLDPGGARSQGSVVEGSPRGCCGDGVGGKYLETHYVLLFGFGSWTLFDSKRN